MESKIVDLEEILALARRGGFRNRIVLIAGEPKTGKTETLEKIIAATPMVGHWFSYHVRCDVADPAPLPRGRHGILFLDDVERFVQRGVISAASAVIRVRVAAEALCGTIIATEHAHLVGHRAHSLAEVADYVLRTRVGELGKYDVLKAASTYPAELHD